MVSKKQKFMAPLFFSILIQLGVPAASNCLATSQDFKQTNTNPGTMRLNENLLRQTRETDAGPAAARLNEDPLRQTRETDTGPDAARLNEYAKPSQTPCDMPRQILKSQSHDEVEIPSIAEAIEIALQTAAAQASRLLEPGAHEKGKIRRVPSSAYQSIGAALAAARSGDIVLVQPGTYHEQLVMKDGVKLISSPDRHGDEFVPVRFARLKLPRRAIRTIIDGARASRPEQGVIRFPPGAGRNTVIDGFTIRNPPRPNQQAQTPGLNILGASPVIMNCLIQKTGGTGINNDVIYHDEKNPLHSRDFRQANIKHASSAIIYNNIIRDNRGLGIACYHFSTPLILGNEILRNNDAQPGRTASPGVGGKQGSAAAISGNIVHDNPGGGILAIAGEPQGKYSVDRVAHPSIIANVVYDNGGSRPGIAAREVGEENSPIIIRGNYVYNGGMNGIAVSEGSVGIIEDNILSNTKNSPITVNNSTALRLNRNQMANLNQTPGITIMNSAVVHEMAGNAVDNDNSDTPPYRLGAASVINCQIFQQHFNISEQTLNNTPARAL